MADNYHRQTLTLGTTDTGATDALILKGCNVDQRNFFDISVQAASDGTFSVNLERKRRTESTWRVIETYTADTEKIGEIHGAWDVRLNCTDHTTSGNIVLEITQS